MVLTRYGWNMNQAGKKSRRLWMQWMSVPMKKWYSVDSASQLNGLELLCKTAAYLKEQGVHCIRLNTNGLSDLLHERKTAQDLHGLVDIVSISLNAGTEEEYRKVTRPKFPNAFAALQEFAADCKDSVPTIMYSVVDILPKAELDAAQALADRQGIPLRVRKFEH